MDTIEEIENEMPLTPKQEKFCRAYTQNDLTFGSSVLSFAYAYGYDLDTASHELQIDPITQKEKPKSSDYDRMYNTCSVSASRLLRNAKIQKRIQELLLETFNENVVDAELMKVVRQSNRLDAKVQAIKEFNALKGRIVKKQDVTSNGERIVVLPPEILAKHALLQEKEQAKEQ